jgi:hypothetical protein
LLFLYDRYPGVDGAFVHQGNKKSQKGKLILIRVKYHKDFMSHIRGLEISLSLFSRE